MSDDPRLDRETKLVPGNAVAALILVEGRYLLQLRDDKKGIFFPGAWGCFGGGCEAGETCEAALARELHEELALSVDAGSLRYFSRFDFDLGFAGLPPIWRYFYELDLPPAALENIRLGEGADLRAFPADDIVANRVEVTPYDGFALWLHINSRRLVRPPTSS